MSADNIVVVGRIGAAFGIKGWCHVHSFTDPPSNLTQFSQLLVRDPSADWQPLQSFEFQPHQAGLILKLNNHESRNAAEQFVNFELGLKRSALPQLEKNEFYWSDLVGLQVINANEDRLGIVQEILDTGKQNVMRVENTESVYLIPLIKPILLKIDLESHISVQWDASWLA